MKIEIKEIFFESAKAQAKIEGKIVYVGYDTEYVQKQGLVKCMGRTLLMYEQDSPNAWVGLS